MKKRQLLTISLIFWAAIGFSQFVDFYDFNKSSSNYPRGGLTLSADGKTFYGSTALDGSNQNGSIFSVNIDGTNFNKLFDFSGLNGNGPTGSLILCNDILYGLTTNGGESNLGTIFSIHTDGTQFHIIHQFDVKQNGSYPRGALIISGDTLYGGTYEGGNLSLFGGHGGGTLFSILKDGSGFRKLWEFDSLSGGPCGYLTLSNNILYGMTTSSVFSINRNGTDYKSLNNLLSHACGSLLISGNKLFGSSMSGGKPPYYNGFLFSINTDGSEFNHIHDFIGEEGGGPTGNLIQIGNSIYGAASFGGSMTHGTGSIFMINMDGSGFKNLFIFNSTTGNQPLGYLSLLNNRLYGVCNLGGGSGVGTLFNYDLSMNTGMNNHKLNKTNLDIFPNPATDSFVVKYLPKSSETYVTLLVATAEGQVIYESKELPSAGVLLKEYNLINQPAGLYNIVIYDGTQKISRPIIHTK